MSDYVTWSMEHEIPRKPSKLATLELHPCTFTISGPPELISETEMVQAIMQGKDGDEIKYAVYVMWSGWHVLCAASGKEILLCDLRYWTLDGLTYSDPALIPRHKHIP